MTPLLYIGISQSLFAVLLLLIKKNRFVYDIVLAAWLFMISLQLFSVLIGLEYNLQENRWMMMLKMIPFTYGPFLYIYSKMLVLSKPVFRWKYLLHFIPFILASLYYLFIASRTNVIEELNRSFLGGDLSISHIIYATLLIISIVYYVVRILVLLTIHRKKIHNHFSYESQKNNLNWLKTIAIIFAIIYPTSVLARILNLVADHEIFSPIIFPVIGFTFFAYALSIFGFQQESIFISPSFARLQSRKERLALINIEEDDDVAIEEETPNKKYEKSGLKPETYSEYEEKIINYMKSEKPYLDSSFSIQKMSEKLSIQKFYITQVLNESLNKNFYTFVNEYRIEEVKNMIKSGDDNKYTLLSLAFDSGFNSKTSFNTTFKKYTGKTPSQYRKEVLGSNNKV
ncbi:MAG: helix-turn-helix domain-containing protein [Bacteroidota bacterium]